MSQAPGSIGRCPRCDHEVLSAEWVCPACEYVLDTGFLGAHITNEPPPSPRPPPGDEPAITFVVGGPRPPAPAFQRRAATQPVALTLDDGLLLVLVEQLVHFSIQQRHLASPFNIFQIEAWTGFLQGRPILLAVPALTNMTFEDARTREQSALDIQYAGLSSSARRFMRQRLCGGMCRLPDGRRAFAQHAVVGVRLRELLSASRAENNVIPEELAMAAVSAVHHATRTDASTDPTGGPVDVFVGFDGSISVARSIHAMSIDDRFSQWTSDQLAPRGPQGIAGLLGKDAALSDELALIVRPALALPRDPRPYREQHAAFIAQIDALLEARGASVPALLSGIAEGVFPDRAAMSRVGAAMGEDRRSAPLVFPMLRPFSMPGEGEFSLESGARITRAPLSVAGTEREDVAALLADAQRRLPTDVEMQEALDAGALTVVVGPTWLSTAREEFALGVMQSGKVITDGMAVAMLPTRAARAVYLVDDPVAWPRDGVDAAPPSPRAATPTVRWQVTSIAKGGGRKHMHSLGPNERLELFPYLAVETRDGRAFVILTGPWGKGSGAVDGVAVTQKGTGPLRSGARVTNHFRADPTFLLELEHSDDEP